MNIDLSVRVHTSVPRSCYIWVYFLVYVLYPLLCVTALPTPVVYYPKTVSADLTWRIVWLHYYKEYSNRDIADLLYVHITTVRRFIAHGPKCMLGQQDEDTIVELLMDNPAMYFVGRVKSCSYAALLVHNLDNNKWWTDKR